MRERVVYYETRSGRGTIGYVERGARAFGFVFNPVLAVKHNCNYKISAFEKILRKIGVDFYKEEVVEERQNGIREMVVFKVNSFAYNLHKKNLDNGPENPFRIEDENAGTLNERALVENLYETPGLPQPAPQAKPPGEIAPEMPAMLPERPGRLTGAVGKPKIESRRPQKLPLPDYTQREIENQNLHRRRTLAYLEKRGVLDMLLEKGVMHCDRDYHLKLSHKDHGARGIDAARAICKQLSKLGVEHRNIRRTIREDYGDIALTDGGKQQLLEIRKSCSV